MDNGSNEHDFNLVKLVSDMLSDAGHPRPTDWERMLDKRIHNETSFETQRFLVNKCLSTILGLVTTENTIDARYCLINTGEFKDWLRLFKQGVLPTLVRLNLPPAIN
jgi:hypothetical protein